MKTSKTNRIIALMMAMLVFVSSTGFSIDLHYCQDQVKSFSLFGEAESCHQQAEKKHCKKKKKSCHAAKTIQEKQGDCAAGCCSNKTIQLESNEEAIQLQSVEFSQKQVKFLTAFVQVFLLETIDLSKTIIPHINYVPPLLNKDIPILIQSFLL